MNRWSRRIRGGRLAVVAALIWAVLPQALPAQAAVSDPCGTGSNPVVCENSKTGSPMSDWYSPNSYGGIKGFTTKESVQAGETVQFKMILKRDDPACRCPTAMQHNDSFFCLFGGNSRRNNLFSVLVHN
jgi:hypothetical protein